MRDTSSDLQGKRQFVNGESFLHPPKSKTAKVGNGSKIKKTISASNTYENLAGEDAGGWSSGVSRIINFKPDPKTKKMNPIMTIFPRVDTAVVNAINIQTSGQIFLEYETKGIKIRT